MKRKSQGKPEPNQEPTKQLTQDRTLRQDGKDRDYSNESFEESGDNERYFGLLWKHSPLAIGIVQDGLFKFVNQAFCNFCGYTNDEITDWKPYEYSKIVHPDNRKFVMDQMKKKRDGAPDAVEHYQFKGLTKSGEIKWLDLYSTAIMYGKRTADLVTILDISERKRAEEQLNLSVRRLRESLGATIQAMAMTVEARDPYTAGHQRRVSDLARAIATEMGLDHDLIEGVRMAGSIHDIGKISVPAEILSKPSKLSPLEYQLIKIHPQAGHEILKDIDFPWPIARIILEHHERVNGSGYPNGLTGEKVLLESRIIAVADTVEAMASHRPYRPSLGVDEALEEISRQSGVLFDPDVAAACLKLFREKEYKLPD